MITDGLEPGSILRDRYRVDGVLGQGGFAITYLGFDLTLHRRIALKELFLEGCSRRDRTVVPSRTVAESFQTTLERFALEARTLASFDHPGIVTVYEVFEENATAYLVMEYLAGTTLDELVTQAGPISPGKLRPILSELLRALSIVHGKGLLHRDIKPSNVMVGEQGRVALIDFGAARSFQSSSATHTKLVSYGYSPIEQFGAAPLTPAADLYALSATAYFALTGYAPPASTDRAAGAETLPTAQTFTNDHALGDVVLMGLDMASLRRPQSADEYRSLLANQSPTQPQPHLAVPNRTVLLNNDGMASAAAAAHPVTPPRQGMSKGILIGGCLVIAALCATLITVIVRKDDRVRVVASRTQASTTSTSTQPARTDTTLASVTPETTPTDASTVEDAFSETTTTFDDFAQPKPAASPTPPPPVEEGIESLPIIGIVDGTNGVDDVTNKRGEGFVSRRSSPDSKSPELGRIYEGRSVTIACQVIGTTSRSTKYGKSQVWDRLEDGSYVAHVYIRSGTSRYEITMPC